MGSAMGSRPTGLIKLTMLALAAGLILSACARPDAHPFGVKAVTEKALRGQLYHLKEGARRLPDFRLYAPKATVFARTLNVDVANDVNGFPGLTDHNEWFAMDYHAGLTVAAPGTYGFRLVSDDGARLLIDGRTVIDNDGVHTPTSASGALTLAAGAHPVEVQYFKGPHYRAALQLYCTAPGGAEALFPNCGGLALVTIHRWTDNVWWMWLLALFLLAMGWWWLTSRKRA